MPFRSAHSLTRSHHSNVDCAPKHLHRQQPEARLGDDSNCKHVQSTFVVCCVFWANEHISYRVFVYCSPAQWLFYNCNCMHFWQLSTKSTRKQCKRCNFTFREPHATWERTEKHQFIVFIYVVCILPCACAFPMHISLIFWCVCSKFFIHEKIEAWATSSQSINNNPFGIMTVTSKYNDDIRTTLSMSSMLSFTEATERGGKRTR